MCNHHAMEVESIATTFSLQILCIYMHMCTSTEAFLYISKQLLYMQDHSKMCYYHFMYHILVSLNSVCRHYNHITVRGMATPANR